MYSTRTGTGTCSLYVHREVTTYIYLIKSIAMSSSLSRHSTRAVTSSSGSVILPVVMASTLAVAAGVSMVISPRRQRNRNRKTAEETSDDDELSEVILDKEGRESDEIEEYVTADNDGLTGVIPAEEVRENDDARNDETADDDALAGEIPAEEVRAIPTEEVRENEEVEEDQARAIPQWVDVNDDTPVDEAECLTVKGMEDEVVCLQQHSEELCGYQLDKPAEFGAGSVVTEQSDESSKEPATTLALARPIYPPSLFGEIWC